MKHFPSKQFSLHSPLTAEEVINKLSAEVTPQGKEFRGTVAGNNFSMRNRSTFPSIVTGTISSAKTGSDIQVKVEQDKKLTLGEAVLLVVLMLIAPLFFPNLISDTKHILLLIGVIITLYGVCFFSEIAQAKNFLTEKAEVTSGEEAA